MVRRRTFLEALSGAAVYPTLADQSEDFEHIETYREMFLESDGSKDKHPTTSGLSGWNRFQSGPLEINDIEVEAAIEVMCVEAEPGLQFTGRDDDLEAVSTVFLSMDEARDIRDALDETIQMLEEADEA